MARKDYEAAMAKIAAVSKADQTECAKQASPAAKACTIQANGKRTASEEGAKLALARAREQHPASKQEQEKPPQRENGKPRPSITWCKPE